MQIGMIGLGRMGANMARRLTNGGHQCVAFDRNRETVDALAKEGRGSVVSSWLLDLTATALASDRQLAGYTGFVEDSGEGRWTIAAALEEGVSAEVLSVALYTRFRSRQEHTFAEKVLSGMRKGFGGHAERPPAVKMKQGL